MATATKPNADKPNGSKDGIEWRTDTKGRRKYRGMVFSKVTGKRTGPWGSNAEARSWRSKALGEIEAGTAVKSSPTTLREAWEEFIIGARTGAITSRSRRPFKPSTLRGYERGWAKIDPELGAHRLTDIRRKDIQAMVDTWAGVGMLDKNGRRKPAEPSTIRNALDPLRVLYRRALQREVVTVNPTDGLDVPADIEGHDDGEAIRMSPATAAAYLAVVPEGDRALWATAAYAGLRRGEMRALRVHDLHFDGELADHHGGPHIHVSRTWDDTEGEQTPKTKGSNRRVPIIPVLADILRHHVRTTGRRGGDLLFGRTAELPFTPSTIRNRGVDAFVDADLSPVGLHRLRHGFASMMIAAGCNAKALSVVMGHASISITFDTYGHLMPGGEAEVGRLLGEFVAKAN